MSRVQERLDECTKLLDGATEAHRLVEAQISELEHNGVPSMSHIYCAHVAHLVACVGIVAHMLHKCCTSVACAMVHLLHVAWMLPMLEGIANLWAVG